MSLPAIVLFAHGAREPRWAQPLERLREELAHRHAGMLVALAFLELQSPGLPQVLDECAAAGARRVLLAPLFWSVGGHVTRDLPRMLDEFRARHPGVAVDVLPVLSDLPGMTAFVAEAIGRAAVGSGAP